MTRSGAVLAMVLSGSAVADEPAQRVAPPKPVAVREGLFIEPAVGASLVTFSGPGLFAPSLLVQPELRVGLLGPTFGYGGVVGLGFASAIPGGLFPQLFLGGTGRWMFMPMLGGKLYGSAQAGFASVFSTSGGVFPGFGADVGVGLNLPVLDKLGVSCEVGARTRFFVNSGQVEPNFGINLTFAGQYFPNTVARPPPPPVTLAADPTPKIAREEEEEPIASAAPDPVWGSSKPVCTTWLTDGWMSPTQAVWQDDPSFADKPTKQLTRHVGDPARYTAELAMVRGKPTVVFGVDHYQLEGHGEVKVGARETIVLKGQSTCSVPKPVKLELRVRDGYDRTQTVHTTEVLGNVPFEGDVLPEPVWWEIRLSVPAGIPAQPFKLKRATYRLTAELVKSDGAPTGLRVIVDGRTQESTAPHVTFVPVKLTEQNDDEETQFMALTEAMVKESREQIPDLFPLAPGRLPVSLASTRGFQNEDITSKWFEWRRVDATIAALSDSLSASAFLSNAGRVVAVMRGRDFKGLFGEGAAGMTVGSAVTPKRSTVSLSWKVMLVPSYETWDTVGHELLHTLPEGWADDEMTQECGFEYHNEKTPVAHGARLTREGQGVTPELKKELVALMGPSVNNEQLWITQCTYWHLLKQFAGGPADPPVLLLRAMFAKKGSRFEGELRPAYTTLGVVDLQPGKGPWAFVLKDAKGTELGRFPFRPRFIDPHSGVERVVQAYAARVPDLPGWAQIELHSPSGVLATQKAAASAPQLVISAPADLAAVTGESVHVEWKATVAAGAEPRVSVLTSLDDGRTWEVRAFERKGVSALDVSVDPKAKLQRVKVVVTDGTRSAEAQVRVVR